MNAFSFQACYYVKIKGTRPQGCARCLGSAQQHHYPSYLARSMNTAVPINYGICPFPCLVGCWAIFSVHYIPRPSHLSQSASVPRYQLSLPIRFLRRNLHFLSQSYRTPRAALQSVESNLAMSAEGPQGRLDRSPRGCGRVCGTLNPTVWMWIEI